MAEETDTTTQTTETSSDVDQSTTTPTLDDFLGTETQESTPAEPDTEKIAKKAKDFDGLLPKYQASEKELKQLRAELESLKTQPTTTPTAGFDPEVAKNDPGVNFLLDQLEARVAQRIAPLTAEKQREQDEQAFSTFTQDPYMSALWPQAEAALKKTDPSLSMAQRTEEARKNVILNHLPDIIEASKQVGIETGYKAKNLKASGGLVGKPTVSAGKDDFAERYERGELSTEEMRENMDKIAEIDRQQRNS